MWLIGLVLIFLAIYKKMEPTLLLPIGFGAILVNLPLSGAVTHGTEIGILDVLFNSVLLMSYSPILFIGIGAMIDFYLCLQILVVAVQPCQFGIFFTLSVAGLLGFFSKDAASMDNRCSRSSYINIHRKLSEFKLYWPDCSCAYSYMALVP